jgi:hypothetical protein
MIFEFHARKKRYLKTITKKARAESPCRCCANWPRTGTWDVRLGGRWSAQQLSQELGVSVWSLKRWSKEFPIGEPMGPGAFRASEPASALEIARLWRELEFITRKSEGSWVANSSAAADMQSLVQFCPRIKETGKNLGAC